MWCDVCIVIIVIEWKYVIKNTNFEYSYINKSNNFLSETNIVKSKWSRKEMHKSVISTNDSSVWRTWC